MDVNLEGKRLDQDKSLRYLGNLVTGDGKCNKEIRLSIAMEKVMLGQMRTTLRKLGIEIQTKVQLLKTYVWSVILFGRESCSISREIRKRLEISDT